MYRAHMRDRPHECPRCEEGFNTHETLNDHLKRAEPCHISSAGVAYNSIQGLNMSKREVLKRERKHCSDEAAKWRVVYKVAFPHNVKDADIPSACKSSCKL